MGLRLAGKTAIITGAGNGANTIAPGPMNTPHTCNFGCTETCAALTLAVIQ